MSHSSDATAVASGLDAVIEVFQRGEPVCIHDAADREGETDLIYPASAVTPEAVARLRNDAGGLICVALSDAVSKAFNLPFLQSEIDHPSAARHDLAYDDRSSFSLPVNHRDTRTGITDEDRSLTIRELARAAESPDKVDFASEFRSPGHVHILRGAPGLLADRQGHTELGLALAELAGVEPAVVVCEMLDDHTNEAMTPADAAAYADSHGIPYIEGSVLVERANSL
ncbi:3,4-dihydroxy-2-butanone-4-phosphate synthase [Halovenus halobia]|uniref:3,4-dihydroxy-2-butanone-4-phosphate synthase n=1 Tax=Halovenus halobia TaxID=3396622 RepID=UPI003F542DB1